MFFHNFHTIFPRIADFKLKKGFAELPKDKDGVLFTFNGKSNDLKIKFITNKQSILNDKYQGKTICGLVLTSVGNDADFSRILCAWKRAKKKASSLPTCA